MKFKDILCDQILILDGGMGTEIMKRTRQRFDYPELLNLEKDNVILDIHKAYLEAGADIIETNTLGASRVKLNEHGAGDRVKDFNRAAVNIAKKACAGKNAYVAGSIGPLGKLIQPIGDLSIEEAYAAFAEQAGILEQSGADLLLIETQIDILEAKTALIAAKSETSIPVAVSMTFPFEDTLTVTGSDPATTAITFSATEADIFGVNCGGHPENFEPIIREIVTHSRKPLIIYANAGEPEKKGNTVHFPLGPEEYLKYAIKFYQQGANIIGGCCGTSPEHIRLIAQRLKGEKPVKLKTIEPFFRASSRNSILTIGNSLPFRVIGENINPFAKKKLKKEFKQNKLDLARKYARKQEIAGADALDINLGKRGEDEPGFFAKGVSNIQAVTGLPFFLDNSNPDSLEQALRSYSGKGVINSVTGEKKSYERLFPLAKKYGAGVILLALNENGIPEKAENRIKIIKNLYKIALDQGLNGDDLIADPITLSLASSQASSHETLKAIELAFSLQIPTILGLSNISFGLPLRRLLNAAFLNLAVKSGLDSAILNPLDTNLISSLMAAAALSGRDQGLRNYIKEFSGQPESEPGESEPEKDESLEKKLFRAVLEGEKSPVEALIKKLIDQGKTGFEILEEILSPALQKAGKNYEKKIYFLPQLILSAEAMETASKCLEESFSVKKSTKPGEKIVLATVAGDLHDIGKNIVSLVLRNLGYTLIDLGKNISADKIVAAAIREKADFIGLSALMTTTLDEMERVIAQKNSKAPGIRVIIGGAAVSPSFAEKIGADAYAKDALDAVRKMKEISRQIDKKLPL